MSHSKARHPHFTQPRQRFVLGWSGTERTIMFTLVVSQLTEENSCIHASEAVSN